MIQKKTLFSWIFGRYRGLQLLLLAVITVTVFFRVIPLEIQKRIINSAISLKKIDLLLIYCAFYLGAVVLAGLLKYVINVLQGYIGQKILYEIRTQLYQHVLRLPLPFFRRTPPGMVISALTAELSAVGEFLGGALAVPVINLLTLFAFAGYLFYLNPLLALLSVAIYPAEIVIIPLLQNRYNRLNQDRIDVTRSLSNTIGEAISGIQEVQAHAGFPIENQKFERFVSKLFTLRQRMYFLNYGIKFTNNFFQNLGPFILFLLGGYLAITGRFTLGALVAFLSAYEKLYDPWRELMDYYQDFQDSRVRYRRVMEYFDLEPEFSLAAEERSPHELQGKIEVRSLSYATEGQVQLLDQISLALEPGEHMALVGFSGSGKSTLAMVLGQLYHYCNGQVFLDDRELRTLTKFDVSKNLGFVGQQPFIFDDTIRDNLLYACESLRQLGRDKASPGIPDLQRILDVVRQVGLEEDILRLGLNSVMPQHRWHDLVPRVIRLRERFYHRGMNELGEFIEFFDVGRFLPHRTIYGNIVFGDPLRTDYELDNAVANRSFRNFLREAALEEPLLAVGRELAQHNVMSLRNLGLDPNALEKSTTSPEQFERFRDLVGSIYGSHLNQLTGRDIEILLGLALRFIPAENRDIHLPDSLETKILEARHRFIEAIGGQDLLECRFGEESVGKEKDGAEDGRDAARGFSIYCPSRYLHSKTTLDNILFGRVRTDQPRATERVLQLVLELLAEEKLVDEVMDIGLDFQVGSKGDRLSGGQKQKVALARVLLKTPRILILDEATASLDNASQARIQGLMETELRRKSTVVAVIHRLDTVKGYDQIAVLKAGRIMEMGQYDSLLKKGGIFSDLIRGSSTALGTAY